MADVKTTKDKPVVSGRALQSTVGAGGGRSDNRSAVYLMAILQSWFGRLYDHFSASQRPRRHECCSIHPLENASSSTLILDLRREADFNVRHLPGSYSAALEGLVPDLADGDLFGDAEVVHLTWTRIQALFDQPETSMVLKQAKEGRRAVLLVCYDGDASRLGSSTLRDRGVEAFTVQGGFKELWAEYKRAGYSGTSTEGCFGDSL